MIFEIIMIVLHATQTTLRGSTFKHVHCEGCGEDYVYELERKITAGNREARAALRRALNRAYDVVPCPACGHYQEHMLKKARKKHGSWMNAAGLVMIIPVPILLLLTLLFTGPPKPMPPAVIASMLVVSGLLFISGLGLLVTKAIRSSHFDPNSADPERRKELGRSRAYLQSELEVLLREREQQGDSIEW
jgi:hypothetical protein